MRKILFILATVVLIIFTGIVIYKGTNIGNVWGVTQISQKNTDIDNLNAKLTSLVNVTYPESLTKLNTSTETLQETKKEYENQAIVLADSRYYKQTETYKLEFLWTKLGNYAKADSVEIKIDVVNGDAAGTYNLNFTVTGRYSNVTQFIYDIENDSILGFKIENFNMTGGGATYTNVGSSGYNVTGKFTCKEIKIDIKAIEGQTEQNSNATNTNQTSNTTSNTNTTNTTSASNTTNTESTANTTGGVDSQTMIEEANAVNGNTVR